MFIRLLSILAIVLACALTYANVEKDNGAVLETTMLNVADFGAIPDDEKDDNEAVSGAIKAARSHFPNPVIIQFEVGAYTFSETDSASHNAHILLEDVSNITLKGVRNKTQLIMGNTSANGLVLHNVEDVVIQDLSIDYHPLPFTQGTIVATNAENKTFDIAIDDGFDSPLATHLITQQGRKTRAYLFHPEQKTLTNQFSDQYPIRINKTEEKPLQKISDGHYRFFSVNTIASDFIGHKVVVVGRSRADAIKISQSRDVSVNAVDIFSSPSTGFKVLNSDGLTSISNSRIIPKPKSTRLLSTNADGLHAKFNRAGIVLTDSLMTSLGDDGVNIGGAYQTVFAHPEDKILIIEAHKTYLPGDTVTITDAISGSKKAQSIVGHVERVHWLGRTALKLVLKSTVALALTNEDDESPKLPYLITSLNTTGQNSRIINNQFHNIRGRGVMLHADFSILKNNQFSQFRGPGIVLGPDFAWGESSTGSHSIIEANVFNDIYWNNIIIHGGRAPDMNSPLATRDVVISANEFYKFGRPNSIKGRGEVGPALYFNNASDVRVKNNVFGPHFEQNYKGPLIVLDKVKNIHIENNQVHQETEQWIERRHEQEVSEFYPFH